MELALVAALNALAMSRGSSILERLWYKSPKQIPKATESLGGIVFVLIRVLKNLGPNDLNRLSRSK
ncbi:hypothetical protein EBQ74_11325 [bacterium]|nr:hypothetical protein [bacterium]